MDLPFSKPAITHLGENWTGVGINWNGMRLNVLPTPKDSMVLVLQGGREITLPLVWDAQGKGDALSRQEFSPNSFPRAAEPGETTWVKPQPKAEPEEFWEWGSLCPVRGSER